MNKYAAKRRSFGKVFSPVYNSSFDLSIENQLKSLKSEKPVRIDPRMAELDLLIGKPKIIFIHGKRRCVTANACTICKKKYWVRTDRARQSKYCSLECSHKK